MTPYIQVVTTLPARDLAIGIAAILLERRLAACCQVLGPLHSSYRWQGKVESSEEWQLCAKSRRDLYPEIEQTIREAHPYGVPEILALPVLAGSAAYLAWLDGELRVEPPPQSGDIGNQRA